MSIRRLQPCEGY